jgi:uncharacterized protein YidB (DUF937 family)
MADIGKLYLLLDDPEARNLIFGLAHVASALPAVRPGPARLPAVLLRLADTTRPEQYASWLSGDASNRPMTVDQVRQTIGDAAIADLAQMTGGSRGAVTWQLAAVLPDLVDAVSPGGAVIDAERLAMELAEASAADDSSAGAFGSRVY